MKAEIFETFARRKGLTPCDKVELPECTVYIADGFKNDKPGEYPWGYYETAWATARGEMDVAQCLEFEAFHDPKYPVPDKQKLRINRALKEALAFRDANVETKRYG